MGLLALTQSACQLSTALNFDLQFIIIQSKSESNDAIMLTTINKTLHRDLYLMQQQLLVSTCLYSQVTTAICIVGQYALTQQLLPNNHIGTHKAAAPSSSSFLLRRYETQETITCFLDEKGNLSASGNFCKAKLPAAQQKIILLHLCILLRFPQQSWDPKNDLHSFAHHLKPVIKLRIV